MKTNCATTMSEPHCYKMDQWKIPFENLEDVALVVLYFDFIFAKDNPLFWTTKIMIQLLISEKEET
jgi:hypothetical protein